MTAPMALALIFILLVSMWRRFIPQIEARGWIPMASTQPVFIAVFIVASGSGYAWRRGK